jgi:hypothetical protein
MPPSPGENRQRDQGGTTDLGGGTPGLDKGCSILAPTASLRGSASDGKPLWHTDLSLASVDAVVAGVVYSAQADMDNAHPTQAHLFALDARTGKPLRWSR